MYRHSIRKCDHAQEASWKFFDFAPETKAIFFLRLDANRVLNDTNANFFRQIRTLPQNLILEIFGELVIGHAMNLLRVRCAAKLETKNLNQAATSQYDACD